MNSISTFITTKVAEIRQQTHLEYTIRSIVESMPDMKPTWKEEQKNDSVTRRGVLAVCDVESLIDYFDSEVSRVEGMNVKSLHQEDSYYMLVALRGCLIGFDKLEELVAEEGRIDIEQEEAEELFERTNAIIKRMDQQNMRRACWD